MEKKSFITFSTEVLTKPWMVWLKTHPYRPELNSSTVCMKVANYLKWGQHLKNKYCHSKHLITFMDAQNMGNKLDKEKSRSIGELEVPDFKHNTASANDPSSPTSLLSASPTLTTPLNYGEDVTCSSSTSHHTLTDAMGDSDVVMQDFTGPSPPNPKTGATPMPGATADSTSNVNMAMTDPNITTDPNTGAGAHLTSAMTHISPGPSAGTCSHPSLTLSIFLTLDMVPNWPQCHCLRHVRCWPWCKQCEHSGQCKSQWEWY
ncbi:hypothetical protein EDC04DRAFT_2607088 [Pisolithus marmoratus]|nr:hypothetical protein EDC04DRAFT_2607088 [Pisolithus marmoratus]